MSPVLEKLLARPAEIPQRPATGDQNVKLRIAVVFTSIEPTLSALRAAAKHASRLNACVTLIVPQIVPYPRPLVSPPVLLEFNERRFHVIAGECPVDTTVQIYLCRDRETMLKQVLPPHSVVVIGGRKRWWPTPEKRLGRSLRRAGHDVVFVER